MRTAQEILDSTFLEMRWRTLSLAADLDRIQRAQGGEAALGDERLHKLRRAIEILLRGKENRAAEVQMIFSDTSPPPKK